MCAENPSVSSEGGWFMGNNCILNDRKKDRKKERSYRRHLNIYSPLIYLARTITLLLLLLLLLLLHLCICVFIYSCWL